MLIWMFSMLLRCLLLLSLLFAPTLVTATDWEQVGASGVPVNLEADELSYDKQSGRYQAVGNVHLRQGEMDLRSRILWWNQQTGEVEAEGDVELNSPDERLIGRKLFYNLGQETGQVEDGQLFLREQNLHVRGKTIEKLSEIDYRIIEGTFTTCDGEVPSWKFGASQLDITLQDFARAKHVVFYLSDIPSLYVPYFAYPINTDRESGFLMPSGGYSDRRGVQISNAYYQVLGRNQDATIFVDYLSEMGIGKGLEYRYIFGKQNAGEARAYHIDVDKVDGTRVDEKRYALEWQHDGDLPGDVRMVADALYVNDNDYFQEFGEVAGEYNRDKVESLFSLSKNWGNANLVGQLRYTKDLEADNPDPLQLLPRINFDITRQRIGRTPFSYSFDSEYTNFWRDQGVRGQRLSLRPSLSANFQLLQVLAVNPEIGYRERYYWGLNDGTGSQQEGIVDFSTKVTTRLQRVYDQPIGPVSKLRHSIEPEVTYLYTPEEDQTHLPLFDSIDRISETNRIDYALVQRLTARFDRDGASPSYRTLVYLRLSQSYDLRSEAKDEPFSDLRGEMTLLPTDWSMMRIDAYLDVNNDKWRKYSVEAKVHDQRENSLWLEYRRDLDQQSNYGALRLTTGLLNPVYVNYEKRYDFETSKRLEDVLEVEYRHQCWSALLTYRDNSVDKAIMLSFFMKGIGSVGGLGASLGAR